LSIALIAIASQAAACFGLQEEAVRVRALDPRPLIDLPDSQHVLTLEIDGTVPDQYVIPEQSGVTPVPVESWHTSLRNGFINGLGRFFRGGTTSARYKLVILRAALDYVPTAMLARGSRVVGAAAVQARLRYMVRVVGPTGEVLARDSGEAFSTNQWTDVGGSSSTAAEAIGAMYQSISKQVTAAMQ